MSDVTVKQLAEVVKIPVSKLLEQLKAAGVEKSSASDTVSDQEKMTLLAALRGSNTSTLKSGSKITLKRKSVSSLKVGVGRDSKKVNVEVRKKRTYISRKAVLERESELNAAKEQQQEQQQKQKLEQQQQLQQEQQQQAQLAAAKAEQEAAEKAAARKIKEEKAAAIAQAAEEKKQQQAAEKARQQAVAAEAEEQAKREQEAQREQQLAADDEQQRQLQEERTRAELEQKAAENIRREEERQARLKERKQEPAAKQSRSKLRVDNSRAKRGKRTRASVPASTTVADNKHGFEKPSAPIVREVRVPDNISVGDLAKEMATKATEVIKNLMQMGVMATINQTLDQDTAVLVVEEMGHVAIAVDAQKEEEQQIALDVINKSAKVARPPVVTIMGHVDHGKTSLLDYIRKTKLADAEAGGITQHIGAYHVKTANGIISFLDTPGHAAFTAMRARGAQATDVVVLVVAADDGVMPQTIEAIQHAKAAEVPLIVAVNKIDKPEADPDRVKNELATHDVIPEDWGGENIFVHVSALKGDGINELLEAISLQAELLELTAPATGPASGIVIESSLDKGRGPVATVLVQSGELKRSDMIVTGKEFGRVRAMFDENGKQVKTAGPSIPVQVLGLSGTPNAGDEMVTATDEKKAREIVDLRQNLDREQRLAQRAASKMEEAFNRMTEGDLENVNVLIKADVQGSVEALRESLLKLSTDEVKLNVMAANVGGISETDALLAATSNAFIIGFNVRADNVAKRAIEEQGLELKYYNVIYEAIDDVKAMMGGLLSPDIKENIVGNAEVKDVFKASGFGAVAGCIVTEGFVRKNLPIRVLRDNVVIYQGELESLRRFKDDVNEVRMGTECGIAVKNYNDVKAGDQIEVYEKVEVQRTID